MQNELFQPDRLELLERLRIDGILKETYYDTIGINQESSNTLKLIGPDYLLIGTLQERENSIRIDARLVDTSNGKIVSVATTTLPLSTYTRKLYDDYPTSSERINSTILASSGWQPVNYLVDGNLEISLDAEGQWSIGNIKTDAIGLKSNPYLNKAELIQNIRKTIHSTESWQFVYSSDDEITEFFIESDGQWSMTNPSVIKIDGNGLIENPSKWGDFRITNTFNHGALICRLDTNKAEFFSHGTTILNNKGNIECMINDNDLSNNIGSITLSMNIKKKNNLSNGDFRYRKEFNYGALICRLNTSQDNLFTIGKTNISGKGMIECRINDENLNTNIGSQFISMKVIRK